MTAAFAHRRKTLANSLSLAGVASREAAVAALAVVGRTAAVRAEELAPSGVRRARRGTRHVIASAPAKINLSLVVGPVRPDGKHELVTLYQRVGLADRITLEPASVTTVHGFAADTLVTRALAALDAPHGWRARIEKHVPVAAGLGGGSSDAGTALRLANALLDEPFEPREPTRSPPRSAPTCRSSSPTGHGSVR